MKRSKKLYAVLGNTIMDCCRETWVVAIFEDYKEAQRFTTKINELAYDWEMARDKMTDTIPKKNFRKLDPDMIVGINGTNYSVEIVPYHMKSCDDE
jgi:hypothetical protein